MITLVPRHCARDMRTMHSEMTRLLHQFMHGGTRHDSVERRDFWTPAMDVYEGNDAFTVKAELPGLSIDDVQVEIKDNWLTLKGERKHQTDINEAKYHRVERVYGTFQRSIELPAGFDVDKTEAIFKDGVLKLTVPKAEKAKPKAISITA